MLIQDYLKIKQPEIIIELQKIGFVPFESKTYELDPNFDFFDKLMREIPNKYRGE